MGLRAAESRGAETTWQVPGEGLAEPRRGNIALGATGIIPVPMVAWFLSSSSWGFVGMTLIGLVMVGGGYVAPTRFYRVRDGEGEGMDGAERL